MSALGVPRTSWREARRRLTGREVHTLSLDVFDTLLLRGLAPELLRFRRIADRIAVLLRQRGMERPPQEIFQARLLAARLAYRAATSRQDDGEARHDRIMALQLQALGLPEALAMLLIAAEEDYEIGALSPNPAIVDLAAEAHRLGKRVILISDMYLGVSSMNAILQTHGLRSLADAIYVSSEVGMTKHGGGLYRHVLAKEGLPAAGYFHLGDNRHADCTSARLNGWTAAWCPRPLAWRIANYGWNNFHRLRAAIT